MRDVDQLFYLIEENGVEGLSFVDLDDRQKNALLLKAVKEGRVYAAEVIIDLGVKLACCYCVDTGNSPLHLAILNNDIEMVDLLLPFYDRLPPEQWIFGHSRLLSNSGMALNINYKNFNRQNVVNLAMDLEHWECLHKLMHHRKFSPNQLNKALIHQIYVLLYHDVALKKPIHHDKAVQSRRGELLDYICSLPVQEKEMALIKALDPDSSLGKTLIKPKQSFSARYFFKKELSGAAFKKKIKKELEAMPILESRLENVAGIDIVALDP